MRNITIETLDADGRGVFEVDIEGQMRQVLVPGATPGDRLDVEVVAVSQHHPVAYAEITTVHERGSEFIKPPCHHAAPLRGRCGGCPTMHLSEKLREQAKFDMASELISPLGVEPLWQPAPEQQFYRNRSNFVVRKDGDRVVLGSFAPRSNELARMTGCLVVRPAIEAVHRRLEALLSAKKIPVAAAPEGLRWVSIREAGQNVVVELIVRDGNAPWIADMARDIGAFDEVQGVGVSVNAEKTNAMRRGPTEMVAGSGTLVERYGAVDLVIPPGAFAQLNVAVASMIYEQARRWAGSAALVWDLYCGIGGLGLNAVAGRDDARLWGLEEVEPAVEAARENAANAGVDGQFNMVDLGDEEALSALDPPLGLESPQTVMVNPPRKGMSAPLRKWLLENPMAAENLVYMSCDPKTFARDARQLLQGGWQLEAVEVYDMLPMTGHVEVLGHFQFRSRNS